MMTTLTDNKAIEVALHRQRARATVSSLLVALLAIVLMGILLAIIFIPGLLVEKADLVSYRGAEFVETKPVEKQLNPALQRRPSAPFSSMAKVIAVSTTSPTAIPVPEVPVEVAAVDFGTGDDFGNGWGGGGGGPGGGGTTFFGQKSEAERVAFVIDYSLSMSGEREKLMRDELSRSLQDLRPGMQFQMIFFAGPVWVAGDQVLLLGGDPGRMEKNTVKGQDGNTYEWTTDGGAHGFKPKGKRQKPAWLTIQTTEGKIGNQRRGAEAQAKSIVSDSVKKVQETPLVYGTRWKYALEMAMDLEPPADVIYFMTDGATGKEAMEVAKSVGSRAKQKGTQINCIAMMEPDAHEAMMDLARRTGGQFTIVERGGDRKDVDLKEK